MTSVEFAHGLRRRAVWVNVTFAHDRQPPGFLERRPRRATAGTWRRSIAESRAGLGRAAVGLRHYVGVSRAAPDLTVFAGLSRSFDFQA